MSASESPPEQQQQQHHQQRPGVNETRSSLLMV